MNEKQNDADKEKGSVNSLSVTTYDQLIARIKSDGPYVIKTSDYIVAFNHNFSVAHAEAEDASLGATSMTLTNKFATLSTLVTREAVEAEESIAALADTFLLSPQKVYGISAELQYIEDEIKKHLGIEAFPAIDQAFAAGRQVDHFPENLSVECESDPWRTLHLRKVLDCLINYRWTQHYLGTFGRDQTVSEVFPDINDLAELMDHRFTQGFLLARLVSDYFTRFAIGPLAEKGLAAEDAQERRTAASGKKSKEQKHLRIEMVLTKMEELLLEGQTIAKFGLKKIASVALEDCISEDPNLWRQGKQQLDEYLNDMESDIMAGLLKLNGKPLKRFARFGPCALAPSLDS